jgi:hypothetical protein
VGAEMLSGEKAVEKMIVRVKKTGDEQILNSLYTTRHRRCVT